MQRTDALTYYADASPLTAPGRHADLMTALPADVADLAKIVQGLCIHDVVAGSFYGVDLPAQRQQEIHLRSADALIDAILALDAAPLQVARSPDRRLVSRCHHFVRLLTTMLRAKGIPARARCGFGDYFNPGYFEDHWVCEYWKSDEGRWALADPQFDAIWRDKLNIGYDVLDVPRSRMLAAADAWLACRRGKADASKFGIGFAQLRGQWFIAGNLVRDLAALNKAEMLPWDVWGLQPPLQAALDDQALTTFDRIAQITHNPDANHDELRALYAADPGLRVPPQVFNALLQRTEPSLPIPASSMS